MRFYKYVGFDSKTNHELYRYQPGIVLCWRWLMDLLHGDPCAHAGYKAWLYCMVSDGGLTPGDVFDWRMEVVR